MTQQPSRLSKRLQEMIVPEIRSLVENDMFYFSRSPIIIDGLLRECETMNVIAAPKTGKTWLMMQLAVSIALGRPWLGRTVTAKKILVIDNELHPGELNWRYQEVCRAMGVTLEETEGKLYLWPQRGRLKSLKEIGARLNEFIALGIEVVLLDAFYRAIPEGVDENSNTEIMQLYNTLDLYAKELNSAFILVHHTTKGSQKEKGITDIGAGAGSQSRAADTHLTLLPTTDEHVVEIKGVTRSFASFDPFKICRRFPLWELEEASADAERKSPHEEKRPQSIVIQCLRNFGDKAVYKTELIQAIRRNYRKGWKTVQQWIDEAIAAGEIQTQEVIENNQSCIQLRLKSSTNPRSFQESSTEEFSFPQ